MSYTPKRPGLVTPSEELSVRVRAAIQEKGVDGAASQLGLSRETCLLIAAGAHVARGSVSLAERQIENLDRSTPADSANLVTS